MAGLRWFDQKRCVAAAPDATAHGAAARSGDQGTSRTGVDEALMDRWELPHYVTRREYSSSVVGGRRRAHLHSGQTGRACPGATRGTRAARDLAWGRGS